MDPDFTALASRVAARAEVLGCLILSRDGLVLGSFPPNGERDITPGLLRFAALGEPERGFVQFADELWAYVRQDSYAAFAVADAGTRPGVLLDYLEQALLVAEDARFDRTAAREPVHVDLNRKGVRPGRTLRAMVSEPRDEFRAVVTSGAGTQGATEATHLDAPPVEAVAADTPVRAGDGDQAVTASDRPPPVEPAHAPPMDRSGPPHQPVPSAPPEMPHLGVAAPPSAPPADRGWAVPDVPASPEGAVPFTEVAEVTEIGDEADVAEVADAAQDEPVAPPAEEPPRTDEIDRVALAREFAALLQEEPEAVEEGR